MGHSSPLPKTVVAAGFPYLATRFAAMAHRGGALWEPNLGKENTAHAFFGAVALGYRYLETDVRATRDGRLVCFHDDTLARLTGLAGAVSDYTAAELAAARVGGTEPIPLFEDIVDALPLTRFNVDLKTNDAVEPLVAAIARHRLQDRVLVASFSQRRLSRFRTLTAGSVATAMAPAGAAWTALVPAGAVVASPGAAMQVPVAEPVGRVSLTVVTRATVDRVHRLGKAIHVWTVDEAAEMERLIDLGVDGIITDRPDLLKEVLVRHDLWEQA
ncbi:MAG: glycerophosphodiester phosphodiesterase [Propionibacteriaceae bacterium]|nr:glycerophosphodiester phosphodiesterase [Propionibacteriaceae bacterium]